MIPLQSEDKNVLGLLPYYSHFEETALISGDLEFHWIILLLSFLLSAIPDFYCINFHCVLHSNAFFQESRNYSCVDFNTIGSSF